MLDIQAAARAVSRDVNFDSTATVKSLWKISVRTACLAQLRVRRRSSKELQDIQAITLCVRCYWLLGNHYPELRSVACSLIPVHAEHSEVNVGDSLGQTPDTARPPRL